jgi:quercetin dioxygenase-like cupin family protein
VGHPADQFAYVLSGPLALSLADERLLLHGGDAVMIPRGTPHRWQNTSVEAAQVILVSVRIAH